MGRGLQRSHQKGWDGTRGLDEVDRHLRSMPEVAKGREDGELLVYYQGKWDRIEPGAAGQVLTSNGPGDKPEWATQSSPTISHSVLDRGTADNTIVNTVTKTALYSYSLGAGVLSTNKMVRVTMIGDMLNNSGSTQSYNLHLDWGTTTDLWSNTVTAIGNDADRTVWWGQILIAAKGSTSSQWVQGWWNHSTPDTGSANPGLGGIGAAVTPPEASSSFGAPASENSAGALTVSLNLTMAAAHASFEFVRRYAIVELF